LIPSMATPQTLPELSHHIVAATHHSAPGSRLDVIGLSCTSGMAAIGLERVRAVIQAVRPGIPKTPPIDAGLAALRVRMRANFSRRTLCRGNRGFDRRLFGTSGIEVLHKATSAFDRDLEMTRVFSRLPHRGRPALRRPCGRRPLNLVHVPEDARDGRGAGAQMNAPTPSGVMVVHHLEMFNH
jgi:hypothetical protein